MSLDLLTEFAHPACCDEMCMNHGCNHGPGCPSRMHIPVHDWGLMEDDAPFTAAPSAAPKAFYSPINPVDDTQDTDLFSFDWLVGVIWTGMAWLGFFGMIGVVAFFYGYLSRVPA